MGNEFTPSAALGSLSLIFWALVIVISIKYCIFVMRADNHGEGGILALMAMTGARWSGRGRSLVIFGLFGAALIYGDGIITPAISVLSAVEGLNVATDFFKPHIMPIAVVILVMLFVIQSRGTARIGNAFGPIMLVWFLTIGALGAVGIVHHPEVLAAVNPEYAIKLLIDYGFLGFAVLGGVFLAVTGGEKTIIDKKLNCIFWINRSEHFGVMHDPDGTKCPDGQKPNEHYRSECISNPRRPPALNHKQHH